MADQAHTTEWIGWRDGREVERYPSEQHADYALSRYQVDSVSPAVQPGAYTLCNVHEAGACPAGCEHAYGRGEGADIYLTTEQVETLYRLVQEGVEIGVQVTGDASDRTSVTLVAVRGGDGRSLDNDFASVSPDGETTGWER